jgi:hypothetical protein
MANRDIKLVYPASSAVTITLDSLASSLTLLAGRQSTFIDNTVGYEDYLLSGVIKVSTVSGLIAGLIEIHVVTMEDDNLWPVNFTGTDSDITIASLNYKYQICHPAAVIATTTTVSLTYPFGQISIASLFGGICPKKFLIFVTQSTGKNLHTSGSVIKINPVYHTMVF